MIGGGRILCPEAVLCQRIRSLHDLQALEVALRVFDPLRQRAQWMDVYRRHERARRQAEGQHG